MSVAINNAKTLSLWDESYLPASGVSFAGLNGCAVAFTASVSSGEATVSAPVVGGDIAGILKNNDATQVSPAKRAEVCKLGITNGRALGAFNAGVKLMVGDIYGRLTTWTSGNWAVAKSREAATAQDQMVAVEVYGTPIYG